MGQLVKKHTVLLLHVLTPLNPPWPRKSKNFFPSSQMKTLLVKTLSLSYVSTLAFVIRADHLLVACFNTMGLGCCI